MWKKNLLFLSGVLLFQQMPVLLPLYGILAWPVVLVLHRYLFRAHSLVWLVSGFLWSLLSAHHSLWHKFPVSLAGDDINLSGWVINLPIRKNHNLYFDFHPERATDSRQQAIVLPDKIRLTWYRTDTALYPGQYRHFTVRLKPPTGLHNPGGFDYEQWLYVNKTGARGYVKVQRVSRLPDDASPGLLWSWKILIDKWRFSVRQHLQRIASEGIAIAVLQALVIGDKSRIGAEWWDVFRRTGTNHLMAISGLHISLVALLFHAVCGRLWRLSAFLCEKMPVPVVQSLAAIWAATFYALMAGFSVPTQRALIMLLVFLGATLVKRFSPPHTNLGVALFAVVLMDPVAVLSAGFWFSFLAVAAIALVLSGRIQSQRFMDFLKVQFSVTTLLLPVMLMSLAEISVISPLVNLFMVPLFSFFVVPAGLLITVTSLFFQSTDSSANLFYLHFLEQTLQALKLLSEWSFASAKTGGHHLPDVALLFVAGIFLLLPGSLGNRFAGISILFAVLVIPKKLLPDTFEMTLLDVGQGLAVVIQTGGRTLLYDLGPAYGDHYNATNSVVLPFLRHRQLARVDTLVISHADSDHKGDPDSLFSRFPVATFISGENLETAFQDRQMRCNADNNWQWGQARFEFLSVSGRERYTGNNASCVLKVSFQGRSILLTGDIEKPVEAALARQFPDDLQADVVVIPHHGSATSSTPGFVRQVRPSLVLNSSGYLNRYHFPKTAIKNNWMQLNPVWLDTAKLGAISLKIDADGQIIWSSYAEQSRRYWHVDRN